MKLIKWLKERHVIHTWGKWVQVVLINQLDQKTNAQKRECVVCGKVEREDL
jgi:hypothetical protein